MIDLDQIMRDRLSDDLATRCAAWNKLAAAGLATIARIDSGVRWSLNDAGRAMVEGPNCARGSCGDTPVTFGVPYEPNS